MNKKGLLEGSEFPTWLLQLAVLTAIIIFLSAIIIKYRSQALNIPELQTEILTFQLLYSCLVDEPVIINKEQIFTLTSLLNTKISIDESIESKELIFSIKDISYTADSIGVSCILNQDNSNIWNIYVYGYEKIKEGLDFKKIGQCLVDLEYSYPDYLDDLDINPILTELNSKNCKEGRTYLKNTYK